MILKSKNTKHWTDCFKIYRKVSSDRPRLIARLAATSGSQSQPVVRLVARVFIVTRSKSSALIVSLRNSQHTGPTGPFSWSAAWHNTAFFFSASFSYASLEQPTPAVVVVHVNAVTSARVFRVIHIPWHFTFTHCHCHYLRWRMPPLMRQCWGLQVGPMHDTAGMGKLINAALLTLMRRVWVYAVLPSSWVNSSAPLMCRRDRVTREVGRLGLVGRDRGRRGYWVALYLYIYTARLLMSVFL